MRTFYSIDEFFPIFEHIHDEAFSNPAKFRTLPEVAVTIWAVMRTRGEINNGGLWQWAWNLRANFDFKLFFKTIFYK